MGQTPWNKGLKTPEHVRKKQSLAKKGKPGNATGLKHTPESIAKMSAAKKGKTNITEAGRKAIVLANTGRKHKLIKCPHCDGDIMIYLKEIGYRMIKV